LYKLNKMAEKANDESKRGAKCAYSTWAACVDFAEELKYLKKKQAEELKEQFEAGMKKHYAKADAEYKEALEKAKGEKPKKTGKAAELADMQEQMKAMQAKMAALEGAGGKK